MKKNIIIVSKSFLLYLMKPFRMENKYREVMLFMTLKVDILHLV